jgi:hypothetical protein
VIESVKPNLADLWTTTDIGRYLGVTRARASQIALNPPADFPRAIGKLGHYTVWWRPEVESWAEASYWPSPRRIASPRRVTKRGRATLSAALVERARAA